MGVLEEGVGGFHHLLGTGRRVAGAEANREAVVGGELGDFVVAQENLVAFTERVAVISPLVDFDDGFPSVEANHTRQQVVVARISGVDIPNEPRRVADSVRPDLGARTGFGRERVIFRNAVLAVLAEVGGSDWRVEVGHDAEDLADEIVEALRIGPHHRIFEFAGTAVTTGDVEDAPIGAAGTCSGVEDEVAHGMDLAVHLDAHEFAGGAFKGGVRGVRVGPFEEDGVTEFAPRRGDERRGGPGGLDAWEVGDDGLGRTVGFRIFQMDGVEAPVVGVVGVEGEADEAVGETALGGEAAEEPGLAVAAIEI